MNARGLFDAIHVISDLHWGDTARRRIFREEKRLTEWIHSLARTQGAVALVLNGDIFDFIASYPQGCYIDPADAVAQVDAILGGTGPRAQGSDAIHSLPELARSLRAFVTAAHHHLVLVIGNHDVELAFPEVLDRVLHWLCDTDDNHAGLPAAECVARRARVETRLSGEGWRGCVGTEAGVVYCVHGNAADDDNVVDHEGLRRLSAQVNRGERSLDEVRRIADEVYDAPWGTRFVVDAMNAAKARYPFVDLLKPEDGSLAALLGYLDPALLGSRLDEFLAIYPTRVRQNARGAVLAASPSPPRGARRRPGPGAAGALDVPQQRLRIDDIEHLEALAERDVDPVSLVEQGTLGLFSKLSGSVTRWWRERSERALWQAIRAATWRGRHRTLDDPDGDEVFEEHRTRIGRNVRVFIAGHTHAPRLVSLPRGGIYANSGTWIELLRFPPEVFDAAHWADAREGFGAFLRSLEHRRIDELASLRDHAIIGTAVTVTYLPESGELQCRLHRPLGAPPPNGTPDLLPLTRKVKLP